MRGNLISMLTLAAFAMIGLAGCENASQPLGPELPGPSFSTQSSSGSVWTLLEGTSDIGGVHAIIGEEGGQLRLGQQTLIVPAGAVDGPALFTMKKSSSKLSVTLTATRVTPNDVGSAGFARPLHLIFSYGNVASLPGDASDLVIVWIRPDGTYEPQPTTVDSSAKTVTGEIIHFSDYAMASM